MDDLFNDIDFENETNNNFDDELEPGIIFDDDENKDFDEKVDEKWREKLDLTEPKNSFLRYFEIMQFLFHFLWYKLIFIV